MLFEFRKLIRSSSLSYRILAVYVRNIPCYFNSCLNPTKGDLGFVGDILFHLDPLFSGFGLEMKFRSLRNEITNDFEKKRILLDHIQK